jgi:chorismate synthase
MTGLEHNSSWGGSSDSPIQLGERPDGSLAGMTSGSDIHTRIALKPPSSIAQQQTTLDLEENAQKQLIVKGRHDPVLGPRGVSVAIAMTKIVLADLLLRKRDAL